MNRSTPRRNGVVASTPLWKSPDVYKRQAEAHLREVLKLSPSNVDSMKELVEIYRSLGDEEKAEKYAQKIDIVLANQEKDRAERNKSFS